MKPTSCPLCKSTDITYKTKAYKWECCSCEERFDGSPPEAPNQGEPSFFPSKAAKPKRIFFSYGHDSNRELVDRFKADLEKRGHEVWIDYKEIGTWDDWRGTITRGIHDSELALAFLSIHSTREPGVCRHEIAMALHHFGTIYPVLVETMPWESLPATITHLQWPDLSQWRALMEGPDPQAYDRLYEDKLIEIVNRVEGEATRFASESAVLRRVLVPSVFDAKLSQHLEGFVGREWCFKSFETWLNEQSDSRVYWLKSGPGFGKTALAVQLASRYRAAVVGTWFCDYQSQELCDPRQAVRTLAFQLALRWDDYRARLLPRLDLFAGSGNEQVKAAKVGLDEKNLKDLFEILLANPMAGLIWRDHKLVILLDGLDEATREAEGRNELAALISGSFLDLSKWISFVVTSRPDALVSGHLQRFNPFEISAVDSRNEADLRSFIAQRLMNNGELWNLSAAEQARFTDSLVGKSAGMVLYLRMVEEGLREGTLTVNKIEGMESGLGGLFSRYYQSFEHRFGIATFSTKFQPLLRLLLAAPGPLPLDLAVEVIGINREEGRRIKTILGSYVIEDLQGMTLFHKTLGEWLGNEVSGLFYTDAETAERQLGEYLWKCFCDREKDNFGLTMALRWESQVLGWMPRLMERLEISEDVSAITAYGQLLAERFDLNEAEHQFLKALSIFERNQSHEPSQGAQLLSDLGDIYFTQGKHGEAVTLHRRALGIRENLLGISYKTIPCWGVKSENPTYGDREIKLGTEHIPLAESIFRLARAVAAHNFSYDVEWLYRRSVNILMNVAGYEHQDTSQAIAEMVDTFDTLGHSGNCEILCREAYEALLYKYGETHPATATSMINLASWTNATESEELIKRALDIHMQIFGPDHPKTAEIMLRLGYIQMSHKSYNLAKELFEKALSIFSFYYHPNLKTIRQLEESIEKIIGVKGEPI